MCVPPFNFHSDSQTQKTEWWWPLQGKTSVVIVKFEEILCLYACAQIRIIIALPAKKERAWWPYSDRMKAMTCLPYLFNSTPVAVDGSLVSCRKKYDDVFQVFLFSSWWYVLLAIFTLLIRERVYFFVLWLDRMKWPVAGNSTRWLGRHACQYKKLFISFLQVLNITAVLLLSVNKKTLMCVFLDCWHYSGKWQIIRFAFLRFSLHGYPIFRDSSVLCRWNARNVTGGDLVMSLNGQ